MILNHIVVLTNVFGPIPAVNLMFFRLEEYLPYLKPFLILLNMLPESVNVNGKVYITSDINIDSGIVERLRVINNG